MMVEGSGALIEAARVPGIREVEQLEVEVVTEFVGQRAEKRTKRRDFLAYCGSHPYANDHCVGGVIAEKFRRPALSNPQRSSSENANAATGNLVEL